MYGYEAIAALVADQVDVVFGVLGSSNAAWVADGVRNRGFRYVRTRHEETAVSAATAYSRSTGDIGLATVTLGPGFANSVNALAACVHDHVPVVVLVGESPNSKRPALQHLNQREITAALGAGFDLVTSIDGLESGYWQAVERARWNGRPQVLSISDDLLGQPVTLSGSAPPRPPAAGPDPDAIDAAMDVLRRAEHPLVLAGQGAVLSGCHDDLVGLADMVGARVATTLNTNRFFSGHPHDLGVCGRSAPPIVMEEVYKADVVLAAGASLNEFTTNEGTAFPRATVIQCEIDVDQEFRASRTELGLLGDVGQSVRALAARWSELGLGRRVPSDPTPSWSDVRRSVLKVDLGHDPTRGLDMRSVYCHFDDVLPENRVIVTDGGRAGHSLSMLLYARDCHSWITSRAYGSIGLGLGAAIGAAAAAPGRPVALFAGDGGFMMAAQELDTVRLNGLDLTVVVANDEQYGTEVKYVDKYGLPHDVVRQTMPDIPLLAQAFGGRGVLVRTDDELAALDPPRTGLFLVDARIDPVIDGRAI